MSKKSISINLDSELITELDKRAKKQFMNTSELIESILRRSMLSYKDRGSGISEKFDDKLLGIFSREKRGRKRK